LSHKLEVGSGVPLRPLAMALFAGPDFHTIGLAINITDDLT